MDTQTLSDLILGAQYHRLVEVLGRIPAVLNALDDYGTTPLINAVLMGHAPTVKLLLQQGSMVDFPDDGGQTALFWAVDGNNLELVQLLLEVGADPNAFNTEGQPILAYPLLRSQEPLKKALLSAGADLIFAQDYIQAKLMGHRFELSGSITIPSPKNVLVEMDFEGFIPEFSMAGICQSLEQLLHHYAGRALSDYFDQVRRIIQALETAQALRRLRHRTVDLKKASAEIDALLERYPYLIIPVTFEGHAVTLVRLGPFLAHCDRGERSQTVDAVTIYQCLMPSLMTTAFFKNLIYTLHSKEEINKALQRKLRLVPISSIPTKSQISGNCSWANVEASIPTLLFMLMRAEHPELKAELMQEAAIAFYEAWRDWDKDLALDLCLAHFKEGNQARRACKAGILAAILVQACDPQDAQDLKRAAKIIRALLEKDVRPILETYLKAYSKAVQAPDAQRLIQNLHLQGIDYRALIQTI